MGPIVPTTDIIIEEWANGLRKELLPGLKEVGPEVFVAATLRGG